MTSFKRLGTIRAVIATLSRRGRVAFAVSAAVLLVGIAGTLVTVSNRTTVVVPNDGGTYREGIVGAPRFINPVLASTDADSDLVSLVYSGLVRTGQDGTPVPDLASSWTIAPDGKTYTFTLRDGLTFQDGKPLTSDDVVFTVQKIQDAALRRPSRVAWDGVSVSAPDAATVVFTLQKPYAGFLAQAAVGVLPEHLWSGIGDDAWTTSVYNTEPVGSGPYRVRNVSRSRVGVPESLTLRANRRFALGKPHIRTFVIVCFANKTDAADAFRRGKVDGLASVDSSDVASLSDGGTSIITKPLPRIFGVFFNPIKNKVFTDQAVVSALNIAVDKQAIVDGIFKGYASPLNGPTEGFIDTNTSDYADRKLLAEKTLDAAGWKVNAATGVREKLMGKTKQPLAFSLATANTPELEQAADLIASQYRELGADVDVKVFEIGTLNENVIKGRDFEALLFGQVLRHDTDLYAFWDSSQKVSPGLNITSYANRRVDGFLESAITEPDPAKRLNLYRSVSQQLAKDAPVAFLYAPDFIYLQDRSVRGVVVPPAGGASARFSLAYQWYVRTDRVWKGLAR